MSQSEIISILEKEMRKSSSRLDKLPNDNNISINDVEIWYTETEKLLRVTANLTLQQAEHQVINQLRYAGHHTLKLFKLKETDVNYKNNVLEAYKHCLRAYYDVLDGFCLTFSDIIQNKIIYIENEDKRKELTKKTIAIIKGITEARFKKDTRAEYYQYIVDQLIEGLSLLNEVIESLSTNLLHAPKQDLINSNLELTKRNRRLEAVIESLEQKLNSKFNKFGIQLAISIAIATLLAILFQGVFTNALITNNHKIQFLSQEEHVLSTLPVPEGTIKTTAKQTQITNELEKTIQTTIKKEPDTSEQKQ